MSSAVWQRMKEKEDELRRLELKAADEKDDVKIEALKKELAAKHQETQQLVEEALEEANRLTTQLIGVTKHVSGWFVSWQLLVAVSLIFVVGTCAHYWYSYATFDLNKEVQSVIHESLKGGDE